MDGPGPGPAASSGAFSGASSSIASSTRWAGAPPAAPALRILLEEGGRVAIPEGTHHRDFEELRAFLPPRGVAALSLFSPLPRSVRPGDPFPFRMGSLHPDERRDALNQGIRALEVADALEAPVVVVPPAPLEDPGAEAARPLLAEETDRRVWEALRKRREASARRQLDSFLSTLSPLLDRAARFQLTLAIELGGLPSELPDVPEAERCLREFEGSPLALWVDVLSDARYRRTGGPDGDRLAGDLRPRLGGITVEDGDRRADHLPLGTGEVDLERWTAHGPGSAAAASPAPRERLLWVLDLAHGVREEDFRESRRRLEELLRGPEAPSYDPFHFVKR